MSQVINVRLEMLEQRMIVLQTEINSVLGELQQVLASTVKMNQMAFQVMHDRLTALESPTTIVAEQQQQPAEE